MGRGRIMDKDIMRNASGYYDETAYKAIREVMSMESKVGEIWTMALNQKDQERQFLVLADHGNFVTGLPLYDIEREEHDISVLSKIRMYTNSAMISYSFADRLIEFVKRISDDELNSILRNIAESLGINSTHVFMAPTATVKMEPVDNTEIVRLETQLNLYKELYNDLLDSVVIRK